MVDGYWGTWAGRFQIRQSRVWDQGRHAGLPLPFWPPEHLAGRPPVGRNPSRRFVIPAEAGV